MKLQSATLTATLIACLCIQAEAASIVFSFQGQGAIFDGLTEANVNLIDGSTPFVMTVTSAGGELNSNATGLGVGDANVDGIMESITIIFDTDIFFNFIDLGGVGADALDGVSFTINGMTTNLFTGVTDFNGSTDVFTPSSPISLLAGNSIVLTGSSSTSSFDLDEIGVSAVPELSSMALMLAGIGGMALRRRR